MLGNKKWYLSEQWKEVFVFTTLSIGRKHKKKTTLHVLLSFICVYVWSRMCLVYSSQWPFRKKLKLYPAQIQGFCITLTHMVYVVVTASLFSYCGFTTNVTCFLEPASNIPSVHQCWLSSGSEHMVFKLNSSPKAYLFQRN